MKKYFIQLACSTAAFLITLHTHAQAVTENRCDWVSDKGYWVVESTKKTPKEAIVYFYTNDNTFVYKEAIHDQKLKLNKRKTLYRLKAALEEAIGQWQKGTWASHTKLISNFLQQ